MPINQLYHTWYRKIQELQVGHRVTQIRNITWFMVGIFLSRSLHMSRVACKIPGRSNLMSSTRRLSRFLNNPAINVRAWYEPIARQWVAAQWRCMGEISLIVDGTRVGSGHQLLMVGLAYRKRAVPIAWTWVKQARGHSSTSTQLALLSYVRGLIPKGAAAFIVGDSEPVLAVRPGFGSVDVLRQLKQWHWFYVLRQKMDTCFWSSEQNKWQILSSFIQKAGQSIWVGSGYLTAKAIFPTNLLVHWKIGEDEPWCLATNLPDRVMALRFYKLRMWIEEMFGDLKKHGFDLENTRLHHFLRLSRLTLMVSILYVWLISTGGRVIRDGLRHLVDRVDRRDLSIFQIGLRFIDRLLTNAVVVRISLCSYS